MSMEHRAFVFDYGAFARELLPLLTIALQRNDVTRLLSFVETNRDELVDPYEGEPLTVDWRSMLEVEDAHQVGDFALTKYYDPLLDIGVGDDWLSLREPLRNVLLGRTVGPPDNPFDPGKMGSYFQSIDETKAAWALVKRLSNVPDIVSEFYRRALSEPKGLYITF